MAAIVSTMAATMLDRERDSGDSDDEDACGSPSIRTPVYDGADGEQAKEATDNRSQVEGDENMSNGGGNGLLAFSPEISKKICDSLSLRRKINAVFDPVGVEEEHYVEVHSHLRVLVLMISFSLIVVSVITFTIESMPAFYRKDHVAFFIIESCCIAWFTTELVARAVVCSSIGRFLKSVMNWIDFLAIVPFYLELLLWASSGSKTDDASGLVIIRVVRLTRAFRVFKLSKYNEGLQVVVLALERSTDALSLLTFLTTIATVLFGSAIFYAEQSAAEFNADERVWVRKASYGGPVTPHPFKSIPHSFWWCFVTLTTVGYGDMYPVTFMGYLVASVAIVTGLLLLAFPIIILGINFSDAREEFLKRKKKDTLVQRMQRQVLIERLAAQDASITAAELQNVIGQAIGEKHEVPQEALLEDQNTTELVVFLQHKIELLEERIETLLKTSNANDELSSVAGVSIQNPLATRTRSNMRSFRSARTLKRGVSAMSTELQQPSPRHPV